MKDKLIVFVKGICMGLADIVPGVSGGTMALILGIYERFIEGIRSVNVHWILPLFRWLASGFRSTDDRDAVFAAIRAVHWGFLIPLGLGIVSAFAFGSKVIPTLMDDHPQIMRGFFFGLVAASVFIPLAKLQRRGAREVALLLAAAVATYFFLGASSEPAIRWSSYTVEQAQTLKELVRTYPSVYRTDALYAAPENTALRAAIEQTAPDVAERLDGVLAELEAARASGDLQQLADVREEHHLGRKDPANAFNNVEVPSGTVLLVPSPDYWFVFLAGMLAICAMLLPGISGSFVLLILGAYYFMLSALKGCIETMARLDFPETQIVYVGLFCAGAAIGIFSFARFLSWLFRNHAAPTLAVLSGLMLGSLRVLWPFKVGDTHTGEVENIVPAAWGGETVFTILAAVVGMGLVLGMFFVGERLASRRTEGRLNPAADAQ